MRSGLAQVSVAGLQCSRLVVLARELAVQLLHLVLQPRFALRLALHVGHQRLVARLELVTLLLKHLSTFCLEPGGDSPFRRSITDSVAFGCIPVFFSGAQDEAYSWLWGGWRRAASVSVNRTLFLNGQIDLRKLLGSAPPKLVSLMRRTLAERARAFTVSLEDDPMDTHSSGDQVDRYLAYLLHRTKRR